ncbi:N-acetylglucosamine kinase [Fredinandcohnia sp. 179-A 10B2 NHS]|uniref:N-acetylglucosamine kinase n=1 Tax=Fredinandcohnia sp. 179-A 10B2 NHS TaxID=3235176 RepID=UPI0039A3C6C1
MYVLGIDGGGTKTKGIIADEFGNVYAAEQVGPTNQNGVDIKIVEKEMDSLLTSLQRQNEKVFANLHTVFAGMSGVDRPEAKEVINNIFKKYLPTNVKIIIDNDGVNALYSGTLGLPGIVQISGTGSITFGINENGGRKRVGGWGYLIDDEGSGYEIGREALHAIFKAYDGRGPKTILTDLIQSHFNVTEIPDLITHIYGGNARNIISPLSKYVTEAVDQGDEVAKQIIQQATTKLAHSIMSLYQQLFINDVKMKIPIVLVGGVFLRSELYIPEMEYLLKQKGANVEFLTPEIEPVGGAVAAALVQSDCRLEENFKKNINNYEIIVQ